MADNYQIGSVTFAGDEVSSVQYPYVKLVYGETDTGTVASTTNPIPFVGTVAISTTDNAVTVDSITGTTAVSFTHAIPTGSNAVGSVGVTAMPAVDVTTDNIGVAHMTNVMMNDTGTLTPKFASATITPGVGTLIAAVSGATTRIVRSGITVTESATVELRSGTTIMSGTMSLSSGRIDGFSPVGVWQTHTTNVPVVGSVSAGTMSWDVTYIEVS